MRWTKITTTALAALLTVAAQGQELGERCEPQDQPTRPGISCQATSDFEAHAPYVMNAKKGDVLLSPACGIVGGLLRQVTPAQQYSHSGIMVEDRISVRHSTAAEDRYVVDAGSEGLRMDYIKWGFPGTITESISDAYEGNWDYRDPDDANKAYFLRSFALDPLEGCMDDTTTIFPAVVKPPFDTEELSVGASGQTVRAALESIAEEAEDIDGHYRFYAYSDATIVGRAMGVGEMAPPEAGWAHFDAPHGTVCSQLAWSAAQAAGISLEDSIREPGDREHAGSPLTNGLYQYSEADRGAAAKWLYDSTYDAFFEETGSWGRFWTDAPDDGANQLVNCFGFDWCGDEPYGEWDGEPDSKDSDRWSQDVGLGIAVSPNDISSWDPHPGGVYGLTQEMEYRQASFRSVHRWAASPGTGDLELEVRYDGNPAPGVEVELTGFAPRTSDANGIIVYEAVPAGQLEATGQTDVMLDTGPAQASGLKLITVQPGQQNTATLVLELEPQPPSNTTIDHRKVRVRGTVNMVDHETFGSNETGVFTIDEEVVLDPVNLRSHQFPTQQGCAGNEVRVEVDIQVVLDSNDRSVTAVVNGNLFEGGSCSTDDHEDSGTMAIDAAAGDSGTNTLRLVNGTWNGDDRGSIQLTVTNVRNQ